MTPQPHEITGLGAAEWSWVGAAGSQSQTSVRRGSAETRGRGQDSSEASKVPTAQNLRAPPPCTCKPQEGVFPDTLHPGCFAFLTSPGPAGTPGPTQQPQAPTPPSCWFLADLPIRGQGFRTCAGKPFLVNFSQGARKLVITLCRAEMKQADRLHLITT